MGLQAEISDYVCGKRGSDTLEDDLLAVALPSLGHGKRGRIVLPLFCFQWKRTVGDWHPGGGEWLFPLVP